jgi:hypothetical protein
MGGQMRVLTKFVLCIAIVACATPSESPADETRDALDRLVAHALGEKRFVVVDHLPSEKFVQFNLDREGVVIDLPVLALDEGERERASTLFASVGVRRPALVSDETDAGEAMTFATYRLGFGTNTAKASSFSARVFQEVYLLTADAPLTVTEGE